MIDKKALDELARKLTDQGKLIEAGWVACRIAWVPLDAPAKQVTEMRRAFMAGAQHLFVNIMQIMDPCRESTANDLRRMDLIHRVYRELMSSEPVEVEPTDEQSGGARSR